MTDKIKPLQQVSEAQPEPADFDTWLKEQFEYKNWYYREGGAGGMAVPFARKAWNAGFAKGVLAQQHVGDSRFEEWYGNEFDAKHKGTKQQMREAYEAGMKDTIAAPHPAPAQPPLTEAQYIAALGPLLHEIVCSAGTLRKIVRAIEAARGITKGAA